MKVCPNSECPDIELFGVQGTYGTNVDLCAKCGTSLVLQSDEVTQQSSPSPEYRNLVPLYAPSSSSELAVIKSLLRAEGIFFFVHNEFFGRMHVGVTIPLVNQRTILVADEDLERALEAVTLPDTFEQSRQHRHGPLDVIRMFVEGLAFGWVIPGRRYPYSE